MNIAKGHNEPHGLSIEDRDKLAKQRGLYSLTTLPNTHGYLFHAYAIDGWRFDCEIIKGPDGIHRIGGDATYNNCIGWKPVSYRSP